MYVNIYTYTHIHIHMYICMFSIDTRMKPRHRLLV